MNKPERMERGSRAIARRNGLSLRARVVLALASWVMYALAFIPLYHLVGPSVPALSIPSVAAVAWLLGMRAGLLAGLLAFPLHAVLLTLAGEDGWHVMTHGGLAGSIGLVLVGAIVGHVRNLTQEVKQQLADRKHAERTIDHLNLVLRAIRNVNQLITREKDRDRLIKGACEALVETRGYDHSWVAILDGSGGLTTWAEVGFGESFLSFVDNLKRGELPICAQKALAHSEVVVNRVPSSDCAGCPLGEEHPGRTAMHARLAHAGKVYGLICGSFSEDIDMDEEELSLFGEVAGDIALALHDIELEEEHQRADEMLQASEEKHRTILEDIEEGYYEVDIAGNFTFFNDSLCRISGYPADELLGMNNRQNTDEENARKLYQTFNHVYRTGETAKAFDWEIIRKDGAKRFVEASVSLTRDPAGQPTGFRGIVRDITERKRDKEALQQAHDTLEMRVQKRTADLQRANEALRAEITQREQAEERLREKTQQIIRHQATLLELTKLDYSDLDSSLKVITEMGSKTLGVDRVSVWLLTEDHSEMICESLYKLSENVHEKGLRLQVREYPRYFQALEDGRAIATSDARTDHRTSELSDGYLKPCGILSLMDVTVRLHGKIVAIVAHEHVGLRREWTLEEQDFAASISDIVALALESSDHEKVTEQLRAKEMQLIHAGRLSSLGEMATGVAHEINQPLAIISMAAEGRLRDIERGRFDVNILPRELEDILKNVRRIDRIITHMRTFARRTGEWESVEPEEVLDNVFILLGEQFRIHEISISREIAEGLPAVKVDVNQLEQVFMNILINARQILDEKAEELQRAGKAFEKRLACSISREKLEEEEYVVFEFADNAYGVPDELKTRVFDPFLTTKEPGQGTGLGLSIAYNIVTGALGGKIWVEDNEAGGASFKVALRLGEAP